jgi:hypothetical protein
MAPYTSDTGPPLTNPAAMVLQSASQVAMSETLKASMDVKEKLRCWHKRQSMQQQ